MIYVDEYSIPYVLGENDIDYKGDFVFMGYYVTNMEDKENCYELICDVGGMIIFKGEKCIHFREKLNIDNYNLVLMHYKIDN